MHPQCAGMRPEISYQPRTYRFNQLRSIHHVEVPTQRVSHLTLHTESIVILFTNQNALLGQQIRHFG